MQLTGPYELYCSVGGISWFVINDVTTTATITPASPSSGAQFNVTNYQISLRLPQELIQAAGSSGRESTVDGYVSTQLDVSGANPTTTAVGPLDFPGIPTTQVPASGESLSLPSEPATFGPLTATGTGVTIQQDTDVTVAVDIGGGPFSQYCVTYPNDTFPTTTVDTHTPPSGTVIFPVVAVAGGGATPIPAGSETEVTVAPSSIGPPVSTAVGNETVQSQSTKLAFTGSGPGTQWLVLAGSILMVLGIGLLGLVDLPRRAFVRVAHLSGKRRASG